MKRTGLQYSIEEDNDVNVWKDICNEEYGVKGLKWTNLSYRRHGWFLFYTGYIKEMLSSWGKSVLNEC